MMCLKIHEKYLPNYKKPKVNFFIPLIISIIVFACFAPALYNEFVWDDVHNLVENPNYKGLSLNHLLWMFTTFHDANYHPFCWVTLGFDYILWNLNPAGYHFTNIVFHVLNSVLFYHLILSLFRWMPSFTSVQNSMQIRVCAACGTLFFAVHPLRVETVAWISTRGDLLCAFFYILTIMAYINMRNGKNYITWFFLALFFFACSLLSRAWGITLPIVLLIFDIFFFKSFILAKWATISKNKKILSEKIPFTIMAVYAGILAFNAKKGSMALMDTHTMTDRFFQASYGLCFYIWKTIAPALLSPLYPLDKSFNPFTLQYIVCAMAITGITLLFFIMHKKKPWAICAWLFFVITVSPNLGIAQSGPQFAADRYTYISCMPFAILVGAGILKLWISWPKKKLPSFSWLKTVITTFTALFFLSVLSFIQIPVWHDNISLWNKVLSLYPANALAAGNCGAAYLDKGYADNAIAVYNKVLLFQPNKADIYYNRGVAYHDTGDVQKAIKDYNIAIYLNPNNAKIYYNRGVAYQDTGDVQKAIKDYNIAIYLNPNDLKSYNNRGSIKRKRGDFAGAISDFTKAIEIQPGIAKIYFNRGESMLAIKKFKQAITDFSKALEIAPFNWPKRTITEKLLKNAAASKNTEKR